ncbi:MAG: UDP-N-acetylmuramoyl-L-alanine--D-glutamate ligase, partial [Myxococcota bacterium]|nr:UDP-N-acetylmuramoyl-L-alanine--D-glutamate ligase [Myxococcota bacterium]
NPHAAMAGLGAFSGKRLVASAGGREKNADFSEWADLASAECDHIVLCGATAPRLSNALDGRVSISNANSLSEALDIARDAAQKRGVVVLSPACASFDQFDNFEHRGDVFRDLVVAASRRA